MKLLKSSILVFLFVLLSLYAIRYTLYANIFAQTATDSSDVSEEEVKENIRERLEKVSKSDADENDDSNDTGVKRAFSGTIEDISNHTLTLKSISESKQVEINDSADILDDDRKLIKAENLEIDSFVIAMGFTQDDQVLDAKRIVVSEKPTPVNFDSYLVTITEIDDNTLTANNNQNDDESFTLDTSKDTIITQTVDGDQVEIELSDLKEGDQLVIIAETDPKDPETLDTIAIHLVDGREILAEPDEEATESAEAK